MTGRKREIAVLGGGPAGLAVGHYARAHSVPCTVYEKAGRWGGNCVTHAWRDFRYDSGAHRLHGTDPGVAEECSRLLGGDLFEVKIPSRIFRDGRQFVFPLELKNIVRNMPPTDLAVGLADLLRSACFGNGKNGNFEALAVGRYGRFFAQKFLLDYTEKLWGMPCSELDSSLTGKRLSGLHFWGLVKELLFKNSAPRHMEGKFFYPEGGIGRLTDALAHGCGTDRIRLRSEVTRLFHDSRRILAFELNNGERVEADAVVSTLPMDRLLAMLEPRLAPEAQPDRFRFRNLVLVALFIGKERITDAASLYFPGGGTAFTRAYEPRNRCASMSPPGRTSLVCEIPCDAASPVWTLPDDALAEKVIGPLCKFGWFNRSQILGYEVRRMPDAYPVLAAAHRPFCEAAGAALRQFSNLKISGRNGRFSYSWIHDQMRWGREVVQELVS